MLPHALHGSCRRNLLSECIHESRGVAAPEHDQPLTTVLPHQDNRDRLLAVPNCLREKVTDGEFASELDLDMERLVGVAVEEISRVGTIRLTRTDAGG